MSNSLLWSRRKLMSLTFASLILLAIASGILDTNLSHSRAFLVFFLFLFWLGWELYRGIAHFLEVGRSFEHSYEIWQGLGLALIAGMGLLLRLTGGLLSPFYPLFYLLIAFLASFGTAPQGTLWFAYAFFIELASVYATGFDQHGATSRGALHLFFLGIFAASHHIYLHTMLKQAHFFRNKKLSEPPPPPFSQEKSIQKTPLEPENLGMTMASLEALDSDRQALLSLLKEGLDAHGCAFLWLNAEEHTYEVSSIETDATDIEIGPFSVKTGVPASLFKSGTTLRMANRAEETIIHLPYYKNVRVHSLLAVPVRQEGHIRGALFVDRLHFKPFMAREAALLEATAMVFGRALEIERSYLRSDRDLKSLNALYEAGRRLNELSSDEEFAQETLDIMFDFVDYDWGFISYYQQDSQTHQIIATTENCQYLRRQIFSSGTSLLSLAFKHKSPLPENGIMRTHERILTDHNPELFPDFQSIYILPLILKDENIGAIVLASDDQHCFRNREIRKNIETLSNQVVALLVNARNTQRLAILAQRDGLTNLYNHRSFMEHLSELFKNSPPLLSLLFLDIDHFKQINDTFGHPTGDKVLRKVAQTMLDSFEDEAFIARYGGEEFAILFKNILPEEALQHADRLRKKISQLSFFAEDDELNPFQVTVSIGIASFPIHTTKAEQLIQFADEALYAAKNSGRNTAILYQSISKGEPLSEPLNVDEPLEAQPAWGWGSVPPEAHPQDLAHREDWYWTHTLKSSTPPSENDDDINDPFPPTTSNPSFPFPTDDETNDSPSSPQPLESHK